MGSVCDPGWEVVETEKRDIKGMCIVWLSTSIIMTCILLQQCSQYIVLHPAVAQFVT